MWLSAAVTTFTVLKLGAVMHHAKHRRDQETGASERYRKLADSVPHELWEIAMRIKAQRGVCVGAPEAEIRFRQTLVRGRMKSRGWVTGRPLSTKVESFLQIRTKQIARTII